MHIKVCFEPLCFGQGDSPVQNVDLFCSEQIQLNSVLNMSIKACIRQFLHFPQCFQKTCTAET